MDVILQKCERSSIRNWISNRYKTDGRFRNGICKKISEVLWSIPQLLPNSRACIYSVCISQKSWVMLTVLRCISLDSRVNSSNNAGKQSWLFTNQSRCRKIIKFQGKVRMFGEWECKQHRDIECVSIEQQHVPGHTWPSFCLYD